MTQFDWERKYVKNLKTRGQHERRVSGKLTPHVDYDWENPDANKYAPYVWENKSAAHCNTSQPNLQGFYQPVDDGYNPLRIFFNIFGRLNRAAYVKRWVALLLISSIPGAFLDYGSPVIRSGFYLLTSRSDLLVNIALGVLAVLYIASKALQIRRLHDLGLSGVWIAATIAMDAGLIFANGGLWSLCVVLAVVYNFIFIYFYGTFGPNQYGFDPILRELGDSDPFTSSRFGWLKQSFFTDLIRFIMLFFH